MSRLRCLPLEAQRCPSQILNYQLAQSREQLCEHRDLLTQHISQLGFQVNWEKSKLAPMQSFSFLSLELDSVQHMARLLEDHVWSVLNCLNFIKSRTVVPLKQFERLLGHMAGAVTSLSLLHMRPLQHWLHDQVPRWVWQSGTHRVKITPACRQTLSPWSESLFLLAGVPLEQVSRHAVNSVEFPLPELCRVLPHPSNIGRSPYHSISPLSLAGATSVTFHTLYCLVHMCIRHITSLWLDVAPQRPFHVQGTLSQCY
ncbi:hypothetical protein F2P79_021979 [Pimephales promelas]|nr:hypothetical protein F2P79_021979 [Pimephales promelas]